jgi:hypothetical protein
VLAVMLVILTAGVGLCLFDGHGHHSEHGLGFDLCLGLAMFAVPMFGVVSLLIHAVAIEGLLAVRAIARHAPDPPPKLSFRF